MIFKKFVMLPSIHNSFCSQFVV